MNRSLHFILANKALFFDKINNLSADQFTFDYEDAVPIEEKEIVRKNLLDFNNKKKEKHLC